MAGMDENLLNEVVAAALAAGAAAAEAVGAERRALSITVRLGDLEEGEREASRDLRLRVFVGASASWSTGQWGMVASAGFSGLHRASAFSLGASAIAGDEGGMETGYEGRSVRWQDDLPKPDAIGAEAGRRAAGRLGARKIASTTAPVIFENRLAASLLSPLIGAISGPPIAGGTSFLKQRLGQPVFAKGIAVTDDPHRLRGLGSSPFDDEGVANHTLSLIDDS